MNGPVYCAMATNSASIERRSVAKGLLAFENRLHNAVPMPSLFRAEFKDPSYRWPSTPSIRALHGGLYPPRPLRAVSPLGAGESRH